MFLPLGTIGDIWESGSTRRLRLRRCPDVAQKRDQRTVPTGTFNPLACNDFKTIMVTTVWVASDLKLTFGLKESGGAGRNS